MKSLLIVGAGNFPPEVEELARLNGYDDFVFVDDNPYARCQPVIGPLMYLPTFIPNSKFFILASYAGTFVYLYASVA